MRNKETQPGELETRVPTQEEAEKRLFDIWVQFWRSNQSPKDSDARKSAIDKYFNTLPEDLGASIMSTEDRQLSLLAEIRNRAQRAVMEEREKSRLTRQKVSHSGEIKEV